MSESNLEAAVSKELAKGKYKMESMSGTAAVLVKVQKHNRCVLLLFPPLYLFNRLGGPGRLVLTVQKNGKIRRRRK